MGQTNRLGGWPPKSTGACPSWEAILTASVLRQGSALALLGCFWPRTAFRIKTGKALASSSSGSPTQRWPPSESWDSWRANPKARPHEPGGSKGGGGLRQWNRTRTSGTSPVCRKDNKKSSQVVPKYFSPGPGMRGLWQDPAPSVVQLHTQSWQGWMATA